jgi:type 1 fimbria pilin
MSSYGAVELNVETRAGTSIASQTYTPNINIGNVASNSFSSPTQQTFEFDVTEQGDYVIAIYSAASPWSDCIVGQLILTANSYTSTGINDAMRLNNNEHINNKVYDLQGRQIVNSQLHKGLYIKNGQKVLVK